MAGNVTRRDFFRLSLGTLASLPSVPGIAGAFFLATAPETALAVGADGVDPAHIVLIDPDELGIQVIDVKSGLALPDARITITSFAEGAKTKVLEGDTDSSGVWVSKVEDLCEPEGLSRRVKQYEFYASIDVYKEGYRPFTTSLVRAVAGDGLVVSTQPTEAGKPYPRRASFNEFDVLYTANEFIRSKANDIACALELLVENLPSSATTVTAQVYQDDAPVGKSARFSAKQGAVLASFGGTLLKSDSSDALAAGAGFNVHLTYSSGSGSTTEMIVPLNLVVMDAPEGVDAPMTDADAYSLLALDAPILTDDKKTFTLFNRGASEDPGLSFPKDWPVIGGQKLKIWTPECFIGFAVDPFGFIRISLKTPPLGQKNRYGNNEEDKKWGWHPRKEMKAQIAKYKENIADQKDKERAFMGNWDPFWQEGLNPEALTRDQPTKKLSITAMGELFAVLQWKTKGYIPIYDASDLEGVASAHVNGVIDYNYKQQFVAGGIPLLFTFGVKASLDFSITADITSPSFKELVTGNFDWDLTKTGFFINFCITISVSLGVGIDGLLTVSLRGTFTITLYLGFPVEREPAWPHFAFYLGFSAKVVLQFLLFTHEYTPLPDLQEKVSGKEPLYDNRKSSLEDYVRGALLTEEPAQSMYEFMTEGIKVVSEDSLDARSEFIYSTDFNVSLANNFVGVLECETQSFTTDDGIGYTMDVYVPMAQERFEALKATAMTKLTAGEGDAFESFMASLAQDEGKELLPVFGTDGGELDSRNTFSGRVRYNFVDRPAGEVGGLGLFEGVRPTSDVCISENVFSDPRTTVVSIFGHPCLLRIATVELSSGDVRTRLVLQEVPSDSAYGAPVLLDYKLTVGRFPRYEYYDYSFDVCQTTTLDENGKERCDLHLLVVSGVREDGDDATLVEAAQGHIFSYVRYSFTNPSELDERYAVAVQVTPDKINATGCPDGWSHLYLTPQIKLTDDGSGNKAVAMSFVERAGSNGVAMLNDQSSSETSVGVGMFFAKVVDGGRKETPPVLSLPDLTALREKLGDMGDLALTEMSLLGQASGLKTIKFGGDTTHYLLMGVNPAFSTMLTAQSDDSEEATGEAAEAAPEAEVASEETADASSAPTEEASTDAIPVVIPLDVQAEGAAEGIDAAAMEGQAEVLAEEAGSAAAAATVVTEEAAVVPEEIPTENPDADQLVPQDEGANDAQEETPAESESENPEEATEEEELSPQADPILSVPGISQILRVSDATIASAISADEGVDPDTAAVFPDTQLDLREVPDADYFLTCVKGQLQKVTWGGTDGDPYPVFTPCGPEGVQISSFAVDPTGEFIYWPTVNEGDAPVKLDADGAMQPTTSDKVYRIMACRMRNGSFSKPFLLAEQDGHGFDTLEVLENTRDGIAFVSTEVVDAYEGQGNIWFTVVPHLRCLTVAYLAPETAILHEGDEASFRIALRNDGNTYLKQAKIRLTDEAGDVLAEHTLEFNEENTLVSQWNPQGEDGKPSGVESDYALAPGATSLYRLPGFTVPEGAPHDYYIYASVVEGSLSMADAGLLSESNAQEFLGTGYKTEASGERVLAGKALTMILGPQEEELDIPEQRTSDVTFITNGRKDDGGSKGGGRSSDRGKLPQTGDDAGALGTMAAGMGAAGAALLAYSYRREQVARELEAEGPYYASEDDDR